MNSSRLNRFLKYINYIVAILLLAVLGTVYWFAWRPLPQVSGSVEAPIVRSARVIRDTLGVPHISAESIEDALFLQGYAHAQDRLWQMDTLRRYAAGELSEVIGPSTLETDREMRRLRLRRVAEQHYRTMLPGLRAYFAAYARGVNWFIETHRRKLPVEFALLQYDPRPWTIVDSILAGLFLYRDLTTTWDDDLRKRTLLAGGDPDLVEQLFPVRSGSGTHPGSNAWVIAGKRTATGKPILANDPHLEYSLPAKWYMVHLQAPKLNVIGVSVPGLPAVILGHNERIAWGVTNLHYDVQDLYIEKLNPSTGQYLFNGQVETAQSERELIRVRGQAPVEFSNLITRHGPLWSVRGNQFLTLRWSAAEPGQFSFPFVDLDAAQDWEQFRRTLAEFAGPAQNFVYADVAGNIGYQVAGKLPIRWKQTGDRPIDGTAAENEWDGYIPFEQLPQTLNPETGLIVTANQNPFPEDYSYPVNGSFAPAYRARQIRTILESQNGWKPEDMLRIQKDVYSALHHFLAKQVVAAYTKRGAENRDLTVAVSELRSWNGQMDKDEAAPMLAELIYLRLRRALAERAAPGKSSSYKWPMTGPVLERILRQRPDNWFTDYDQLLLRSLLDAVEEGRRMQGRNVAGWKYGVYNALMLVHPVLSQIPLIGKRFNIGPVPQSGSATSIKQTTQRIGPSMRFVADLSNWDNSLNNILTGQSGQPLSSHYKDQWERHYIGESFGQKFSSCEGDVLVVVPLAK